MTMKFTRVRILGVFLLLAGTASSDDALELTWRNESAAHARYLRPDLIGQVSFAARPPSWRSLFEEDETDPPVASLVFGALPTYDWTDLLR